MRYPAILRTLVLDATYPISDLDPLYRTSATRLRENLALFCARSLATCPTTPGDMVGLVDRVLARIRANPVTTIAPDGTGRETTVVFTPRKVLDALLYTDGTPGWIREAPAALAAFLAGNQRPLGRMVAESAIDPAAAGAPRRPGGLRPRAEIRSFSEGAYLAYACTDYPAIWNKQASFSTRASQYAATLAALPASTFAPWRTAELRGLGLLRLRVLPPLARARSARAALPRRRPLSERADARPERRPRHPHGRLPGACGGPELPAQHLSRGSEHRPCDGAVRRRRLRGRDRPAIRRVDLDG